MQETNLKQKTISGVQWNSVDKFVNLLLNLVVSIVLVRLLGPKNFGLVGIVTIFTNIFYSFVDSGFSSALIRKETISEEDYSTAFFFNLVVSCILYILLFLFAPAIASFFDQNILVALLRVMGLIVILNAICITQVTKLSRDINFKTQAKVSVISVVVSGFTGVSMALTDCGVWSLVGQYISLYGMRCLMLCYYSRWLPKFKFSKESFGYMFGFGWKVLLSNTITNIWIQGNKIIIGKMYPAQMLGYYTKAQDWPNQIANNFGSVIRSVSYPALSQLQEAPDRLLENFRRILKMTFFVSVLLCLGISSVSYSLVHTLYGAEWGPAVIYVQIISIGFIFHAPILFLLSILQIKNRTDIFLYLEIIAKSVALIPFFLGIKYGIMWLVWGSVAMSVFQFLIDLFYSGKQIGYTFRMAKGDLTPSIFVGTIMYVIVWPICLTNMPVQLMLMSQIALSVIVVVCVSKFFCLDEFTETISMIKPLIIKVVKNKK